MSTPFKGFTGDIQHTSEPGLSDSQGLPLIVAQELKIESLFRA